MSTTTTSTVSRSLSTYDVAFIALCAALMAICSWISIPLSVPITLQTFGVFMAVLLLGGKRGTLSVLVFILLGAVGLPVFSGFSGGMGIILGSTGGYIIGFIGTALVMWAFERFAGKSLTARVLAMLIGLLVCYAFGTVWFMIVYARNSGAVGLITVLGWCVFPFIIPDLCKIALAYLLAGRIRKALPRLNELN